MGTIQRVSLNRVRLACIVARDPKGRISGRDWSKTVYPIFRFAMLKGVSNG